MITASGPLARALTAGRDAGDLSLPRTAGVLDRIRAIGRELECEPGLTALQIAERVGLARRQAVLLLLRLEEHGHVVREGRRWFPAPSAVR